MQTESIVLGKRSLKDGFITALKRCEERKKIQPGYINRDQIRFLQDVPANTEARQIARALHDAKRAVIVDGDSLESGLAIVNQYKSSWRIGDEVVEKLNVVVYDPEDPNRAEILQDIKEALLLLQRFRNQNKAVFITAPGYAFNFEIDLAKSKDEIGFDLPDFERIIEVKPEQAWSLIRAKVISGKAVFVHEPVLEKTPTIPLILKTLKKDQRDRLNVVKARKGF